MSDSRKERQVRTDTTKVDWFEQKGPYRADSTSLDMLLSSLRLACLLLPNAYSLDELRTDR